MNATKKALAGVALVALLVTGCNTDEIIAPSAEAPLLAPQNVQVSQNAFGEVMISWDPSSHPSLRGYNVYRNDVAESAIVRLTSSPIEGTHYVDEAATWERQYEYRITAVGSNDSESTFSEAVINVETPKRGGKPRPESD